MPAALVEHIKARLPNVDPQIVDEHLRRLDARYFARFSEEEIAAHIVGLADLGIGQAVKVLGSQREPGTLVCTVLAFDHMGAFSLIAGVVSAMGFNILSGDIFTWAAPDAQTPREMTLRRKRIIDHLAISAEAATGDDAWLERLSATLAGNLRGA